MTSRLPATPYDTFLQHFVLLTSVSFLKFPEFSRGPVPFYNVHIVYHLPLKLWCFQSFPSSAFTSHTTISKKFHLFPFLQFPVTVILACISNPSFFTGVSFSAFCCLPWGPAPQMYQNSLDMSIYSQPLTLLTQAYSSFSVPSF